MSKPTETPADSGLEKSAVHVSVQKPQMNKKNEGNSMPENNKKSRHCGAALSASFADGHQVEADPEIVASRRNMASKSRQAPVSKAAIADQFALYSQAEEPEKPKPVKVSIELVEQPFRQVTREQMRAYYWIGKIRDMFLTEEQTWQGMERKLLQEWQQAQEILKARGMN